MCPPSYCCFLLTLLFTMLICHFQIAQLTLITEISVVHRKIIKEVHKSKPTSFYVVVQASAGSLLAGVLQCFLHRAKTDFSTAPNSSPSLKCITLHKHTHTLQASKPLCKRLRQLLTSSHPIPPTGVKIHSGSVSHCTVQYSLPPL